MSIRGPSGNRHRDHEGRHAAAAVALVLVSNLIYLLLALGGSVIGSVVMWLRHRKPTSVEAGIDEFNRGLRALDPHATPPASRWRNQRRVQQG